MVMSTMNDSESLQYVLFTVCIYICFIIRDNVAFDGFRILDYL